MRRTTTSKSLAFAYGLGLIWAVAMVGGCALLMQPMLLLYEGLGIESAVMHTTLTMGLVVALATMVTAAFGYVVHAATSHSESTVATPVRHEAARHRI